MFKNNRRQHQQWINFVSLSSVTDTVGEVKRVGSDVGKC